MNLIIIPVKNEHKSIRETVIVLDSFCKNFFKDKWEILFINDKSVDATKEIINDISSGNILCIDNKFDCGKGSALKTGFVMSEILYKLKQNDNIIFMDGDGQIQPIEIKTFMNLMSLYGADVVIGNKRHLYSVTHYSPKRMIISKCYNFMVRALFGIDYRDTQCGIKIFKKYALESVIERVTSKGYAFDIELLMALKSKGFRVVDAPVNIKPQQNRGSVRISTIIKTFFETISVWARLKRGCYV